MRKQLFLLTIILSLLFGNVVAQTVYVTKTGKKYHAENCRYLSKSSTAISLTDALAKGYSACSVCKPTTTVTTTTIPTSTNSQPQKKEKQNTTVQSKQSSQSVQCSAITKAGTRCKRMTKSPNGKCYQHGGN